MRPFLWTALAALAILLAGCASASPTGATGVPAHRVEANRMLELTFTSDKTYPDPCHDAELTVLFRTPQGRELRVPAFWAGGRTWKVRYASGTPGTHTYLTQCSDSANSKLHGQTGAIEVTPYLGDNPLYRHGPITIAADHRHFAHADGTPFFWLGDTWWMGLCARLHYPQDFTALTADRKDKGFTVVQIVAGLYPDMPAFDPRGANEAGFPWEPEYRRIRPEYFDQADRRLLYLADQGIVPCIVGAWGYHLPWLGVERMKQHWRYLIARYGALPVVWCVAGETTMPWYLSKDKARDAQLQKEGWTQVARYIHEIDPFGRPVTLHPAHQQPTRASVTDPSVVDFECLQTGHGMDEVIAPSAAQIRAARAAAPPVPVIAGEPAYENLLGKIPADVCRKLFWVCLANGAAGHTYGANGIWQVNGADQPYGNSPGGNNWGTLPWSDAMKLPGSGQIARAKKLLLQYDWWRFEPHPEWAAAPADELLDLTDCHWIWFPEGNPAQDAPTQKRYFRRTFTLPAERHVARARLRVSADDACAIRCNGQPVGAVDGWETGQQFDAFAAHLKPGVNVLSITAENKPANVPANPAGLIACLEIDYADGSKLRLTTDAAWRCAKAAASGWDLPAFADATFPQALAVARYGAAPWGMIGGGPAQFRGPQAFGIPGGARLIYVFTGDPIEVRELTPHGACKAFHFDPVTGVRTALGEVQADGAGKWSCAAPRGCTHDWAVVLEP